MVLYIAYIIIVAICMATITYSAVIIFNGTAYDEKYFAVQSAGIKDAVISSPGSKVIVNYNLDKFGKKFDFKFVEECRVFVAQEGKASGHDFHCSSDLNSYDDLSEILKAEKITFEKDGNTIRAS